MAPYSTQGRIDAAIDHINSQAWRGPGVGYGEPGLRPNFFKPDGTPRPVPITGGNRVTVNAGGSSGGASGGGYGGGGYGGGGAAPSYGDVINNILAQQQAARDRAYNEGKAAQERNYAYARGQVDDTTDRALREAYINKMQTLRNLPQQLSAQGLHGGMSETTTASMYNNYGNARNALETERQRQLGALLNTYQNNLAQLAAQRASGEAASLSAMAPQLARIAATNAPMAVSLQQGMMPTTTAAYMRRLEEEE